MKNHGSLRQNESRRSSALAFAMIFWAAGCAPEAGTGNPGGTSGSSGGGVGTTGGTIGGTGGSPGTGGGPTGTGGFVGGTGGTSAGSGGSPGNTGGAMGATGGRVGSTGGTVGATGGRVGNTGGASATGGSIGAGGASAPTAGCSVTTFPPANDQSGSTPHMLTINGTAREYFVGLPSGYSPGQPRRVIFAWHALGGTARQITGNYYGLRSRIPDAIYVSAQGLADSMGGSTGWPNTGGRDIAFLNAMLAWLDANYCVDKRRIFSTGFSYGGMMSDTVACQLGDVFRAIAPVAGSLMGGMRNCVNRPVAAHITHGSADTVVAISGGTGMRDFMIASNHCTTTSQPIDPSPCVAYSGCDAGYPVVWCEHTGGHSVPSFASAAIATFFLQF